jgi:hypothetical protein
MIFLCWSMVRAHPRNASPDLLRQSYGAVSATPSESIWSSSTSIVFSLSSSTNFVWTEDPEKACTAVQRPFAARRPPPSGVRRRRPPIPRRPCAHPRRSSVVRVSLAVAARHGGRAVLHVTSDLHPTPHTQLAKRRRYSLLLDR